jgi:hypothetical protein
MRQGCPFSPLLCNTVFESVARIIKQERNKRDTNGEKEVKLCVFAHDMFPFLKTLRLHQKTLRSYKHIQENMVY